MRIGKLSRGRVEYESQFYCCLGCSNVFVEPQLLSSAAKVRELFPTPSGEMCHDESNERLAVERRYYQLHGRWPRPPEVPYLRLRGYWMQKAGFSVGQRVQVHIADHCITIIPVR